MSDFPALETQRLLLRELVAGDAPALFAIHGDAPSMRWYGVDPMVDVRQAQKLIETFAGWRKMPNPGVRWGIERMSDAMLIGSCGTVAFNLLFGRRSLSGSPIGGLAETQEMLDFCGQHNITADVEVIAIQQVNEAYERLLKADVKYRFSIDMASLKSA